MSAPDASKAILGSGVLKVGNTELGIIGNVVLRIPSMAKILMKEENNAPLKCHFLGGPLILGCIIKGWEDDAIMTLIPNGSAGPKVTWPFVGAPAVLPEVTFDPIKPGNPRIKLLNAQAVPEAESFWVFSAYQYLEVRVAIIAEEGEVGPST